MDNSIIICILIILGVTWFIFFSWLLFSKSINFALQIKEENAKNELLKIYSSIDIREIDKIVDERLKGLLERWVLVNITSQNGDYMKGEDIEECIRYMTKTFVTDCSELYLYYIKLINNITSDEDLIKFVREKSKFLVLDFTTEFNR